MKALAQRPPAVPLASSQQTCKSLLQRLPGVSLKQCLANHPSGAASVQGQPLLVRDFVPNRNQGKVPRRILLVGGIHGDELTSSILTFQWIQYLEKSQFQVFHWRVIPVLNPDGLSAKPAPTRYNARGVDINRNFETPDWQDQAQNYWVNRTQRDRRRYPGPSAASEPETRYLQDEIRKFKPNAIVQVHAPYGVLDYDGPPEPPTNIGFLRLRSLGTYPGSLGNYAGNYLGIPVLTLELPKADVLPNESQMNRMWVDLQSWLDNHLPPPAKPVYGSYDGVLSQ